MSQDASPLPPFTLLSTEDGVLRVRVKSHPRDVSELRLIVALRELDQNAASEFWSGALDDDLLCYPLAEHASIQRVTAPMGRRLWVTCVGRNSRGDGVIVSDFECVSEPSAPMKPERPVARHVHELNEAIPLTFVEGEAPPNFPQLAKRVAMGVTSVHDKGQRPPRAGCFGGRQRWSLLRLRWTPQPGGVFWLIRRNAYVDSHTVASWVKQRPSDAMQLDGAYDGLIDALTPEDTFCYYVVILELDEKKEVVPLSVVAPPFGEPLNPVHLGPVQSRLEAEVQRLLFLIDEGGALWRRDAELELLQGLAKPLPRESTLHKQVDACVRKNARGNRF